MKRFFTILSWLPNYQQKNLSKDLTAGLTVGVMLIPQGLAYAMIAGLPPVYGLYAAIVPQIIYSILGTSRQLSVGPVAMDSLLVATGISTLAITGSDQYIMMAITLSLMMGLFQLVFGILKLGFLANFLSKPVISGFTSAAALIIGFNQLTHLLGIHIDRNNNIFIIFYQAIVHLNTFNWITLTIAIIGVLIIKKIKLLHRDIPGALVAVILGIAIVKFAHLDAYGVAIIGEVPKGLPPLSLSILNIDYFIDLFPIAITLAIIAFMESISVAKALQSTHKKEYKLDNNQEMISLGLANIIGSFFSSYPTTGGFSRSAVNNQAGAKTNLASLVSASLIILTLMFLTPLFYYLPKAVLGGIIGVAVYGLVDVSYPLFLWKAKKEDFLMLFIAFITTLSLGIKEGIVAGLIASLVMLVYRTTKPHMAILGQLPNTNDFRNVNRFEEIETREDILILRHDAQLYFANTDHFIENVKVAIDKKGDRLKLVIFHCGSISSIDATALQAVKELIQELNENNIGVYFSGLIGPVRDFLQKTGFVKDIGENHFFLDVPNAIFYLDHGAKKRSKQQVKRALQTNIFKEKEI